MEHGNITADDAAKPYPTGPTLHPAVIEAAHDLMYRAHQSGKWDLPPKICMVKHEDGISSPLVPLDFPQALWCDTHPAEVLTTLAAAITARPILMADVRLTTDGGSSFAKTTDRPELVGDIIVLEQHGIYSDDLTPTEQRDLDRWRKSHRLEEHPKARESRGITAIDRHGVAGLIQHVRDSVPEREFTYRIEGRIPAALTMFYRAFASEWNAARS
jgi:hypothetical protein